MVYWNWKKGVILKIKFDHKSEDMYTPIDADKKEMSTILRTLAELSLDTRSKQLEYVVNCGMKDGSKVLALINLGIVWEKRERHTKMANVKAAIDEFEKC